MWVVGRCHRRFLSSFLTRFAVWAIVAIELRQSSKDLAADLVIHHLHRAETSGRGVSGDDELREEGVMTGRWISGFVERTPPVCLLTAGR